MPNPSPSPQLSPGMHKATLLLPLLLGLLATLFFYGLGGGRGDKATATQPGIEGINMTLPSPQPSKGKAPDKVGYYHQADIDSARKAEQRRTDPYFIAADTPQVSNPGGMMTLSRTEADRKADHLLQQVEDMKRVLAAHQLIPTVNHPAWIEPVPIGHRFPETPAASRDPEMDRIDDVLEKLIRIQHPDLIRIDTAHKSESPLLVTLTADQIEQGQGFIDICDNGPRDSLRENAIPAEISTDQTITTGSTVEMQISRTVNIAGYFLPKGQLLHGIASLNGERLMIAISSIRVGQSILPVALQTYDLDGLAGIRVPGAILRDASKESTDQVINSLATASVDPSLGAQAASAGLQFARSLATKKVRMVQVAIPAGYQVLLKNVRH